MLCFFILICILAAFAVWKLLPVFGAGFQTFTDIIIENVSESGFDKSGELRLFWIVTVIGILLLAAAAFCAARFGRASATKTGARFGTDTAKKTGARVLPSAAFLKSNGSACLTAAMLLFPFTAYLAAFGQFSFPLFFALLLFVLSCLFFPKQKELFLLLYILSYYGLISVLTAAVHVTPAAALSRERIYLLSSLLALLLCGLSLWRKNFGSRAVLLLQLLLPCLLLVFFTDRYLYRGELIRVPYAEGYRAFFILLLLACSVLLLLHLIRSLAKLSCSDGSPAAKLPDSLVCAVTPILIFVYHSFSAAPMYAQPDQHHHGEQMIPWNQVFAHGQSLYREYTPVSGLFPFVNGFFQNKLLDGSVSDYSPAISITIVIFCIVTMLLLYLHVDGFYATLFAVLFTLPAYNRQYMVLPVLLVLTLPALWRRKALWLQVWIFSCFLAGLYYPLYGAALLLGTAVPGMFQLASYVRQKEWRKDFCRPAFYITSAIVLFPIICAFPLMIRMLKHTLTYSSQTIMADGIPLLGQQAPSYFLPYLTSFDRLRQFCYLALRFLLPTVGIWLFVLCLALLLIQKKQRSLSLVGKAASPSPVMLFFAAGALTLAVSYSYTLVRADVDKMLSRTAPVLTAVAGMYLPVLLLRQAKKHALSGSLILLSGICVSLPFLLYPQTAATKNPDMWIYPDGAAQLVMDDASRLYSYYEVPDTFVKSEDTGLPERYQKLLGRGFMVSDQIHYIEEYSRVIEKCEAVAPGTAYMAFDGQGFYDYLDVPCAATGYIPAARSYEAQREILESIKNRLPVVFFPQPRFNYYVFRFMLDAGYAYCADDNAFYPPELYARLFPTNDAALDDGGTAFAGDDYRLSRDEAPSSEAALTLQGSGEAFGHSIDTLLPRIRTEQTRRLSQNELPEEFCGSDFDLLYVSLSCEEADIPKGSTLRITWADSEGRRFESALVSCGILDGEILLPMGMNACWLLSRIEDFKLEILPPDGSEPLYCTTYQKLKSREETSAYIKELSLMQLDTALQTATP